MNPEILSKWINEVQEYDFPPKFTRQLGIYPCKLYPFSMRVLGILCLLFPFLSWVQSSQSQIYSLFRQVDSARAASDTMQWIQSLDALAEVYEGKQKRGSPIEINLDEEKEEDPQVVSAADSLESLSTQRDTIWAWYGFDLSRPLTDSSGLHEVPFRRLGRR